MNYKNRGMFLETIINSTIQFYKIHNKGIFHKKSVPVIVSKVQKNQTGKQKINQGWITSKSTADYYGLYNGLFIAFEAKSTKLNRLPLDNIKQHQIDYLKKVNAHGGLGFFIVYFAVSEQFFFITVDILKKINKKSISLEDAQKYGFLMELTYPGIIDFLPIIDSEF